MDDRDDIPSSSGDGEYRGEPNAAAASPAPDPKPAPVDLQAPQGEPPHCLESRRLVPSTSTTIGEPREDWPLCSLHYQAEQPRRRGPKIGRAKPRRQQVPRHKGPATDLLDQLHESSII